MEIICWPVDNRLKHPPHTPSSARPGAQPWASLTPSSAPVTAPPPPTQPLPTCVLGLGSQPGLSSPPPSPCCAAPSVHLLDTCLSYSINRTLPFPPCPTSLPRPCVAGTPLHTCPCTPLTRTQECTHTHAGAAHAHTHRGIPASGSVLGTAPPQPSTCIVHLHLA